LHNRDFRKQNSWGEAIHLWDDLIFPIKEFLRTLLFEGGKIKLDKI